MLGRLRERLTYANVISTLALFVALGTGTAYATHLVVRSSDVVNDTLLSEDLKNGAAVKGKDVVLDSLRGPDIKESTLGRVPSATLGGRGRYQINEDECDPDTATYNHCASTTFNLPERARVLLIGRTTALNEVSTSPASGFCRLRTTAGPVPNTRVSIEVRPEGGYEHLSIAGVTDILPPGEHSFRMACNDVDGNTAYLATGLTAVAISSA
jgi:hypothetical protein